MKLVPLKDICTVFGDGDWIESKDQSNEGIRLIQTGNVGSGIFKDRIEKARWISEDTFKRLRCTEIGEGDVLISRLPDPVGRACLLPTLEHKAVTAVDCSIVRFDANKMDSKFFVYYSQSSEYASAIEPLISGSTRQRISREKLGTVQIPLPSLEKQREIVEKLDSAFAEIDLLEGNLLKQKEQFDLLLRGSLSVPYKSSAKPVIRAMQLGEIADFQGGSQPAKSNFVYKEQKGYVRFIQIRDFGSNKNLTYIPISPKNRLCTESDILIGRYGASVGKILTGLEGAYNVALMKVIPKSEIVDRDYLYFYLLSELFQQNLLNVSDRSAQNGFSKEDISTFLVNLPSIPEQKKIVKTLSSIRNDILEANSRNLMAKSKCTSLRQSFLSSSFNQEEAVA
ncbi:MAG: restriction endonuclease subunit S [Actinomycetales bacterium]|nr:MAG: restriction endonuclease subunit S [Actinomycetales bacterium]